MGPIPTLPPNPQPPPNNRYQHPRRPSPHADHDLVLDVDQPATTRSERDPDAALEEAALRAHRKLAEADQGRPAQEPEPLGRRLPPTLDTAREGVER